MLPESAVRVKIAVFYFQEDEDATRLAKSFSSRYGIEVAPSSQIDYSRPFFLINGSYEYHQRTLQIVRNLHKVEGYVHIDDHDDIGLVPSDTTSPDYEYGQANFVEGILALGKKVVYVGQRYWSNYLVFRRRLYIGLMRQNLARYKPIDSIYFIREGAPVVFHCGKALLHLILPVLGELLSSGDTEAVYVAEDSVDKIPREHREKFQTFKPEEVTVFNYDGTPIGAENEYYNPVFLMFRKTCTFQTLPIRDAYVSIDMDVVPGSPLEIVDGSIRALLRNEVNIVGVDICGLNPNDELSFAILKRVLAALADRSWQDLKDYIIKHGEKLGKRG